MEFLVWHYTQGFSFYLNRWVFYTQWVNHYFSLTTLLSTLFSPWKRLVEEDKSPGFNIQKYFEAFMFNVISRGIGAVVRFTLIWAGLIILLLVYFGGAIGVIIWLILPIIGLPSFLKWRKRPEEYMRALTLELKESNKDPFTVIFESDAGNFLLEHIGLSFQQLNENSQLDVVHFDKKVFKGFGQLIQFLIKQNVWKGDFLRKYGLKEEDFLLAARWWNDQRTAETQIAGEDFFGRPGIGLELLYGYTPTLNLYSIDLSAPQSFSHRLIGRENVVQQMERVLTSGASVNLIGKPGVGKKTVVLEFANRASQGKLGSHMAYRRVLELDYNSLLSSSGDLNQKKTQFAQILAEASYAGNIILMIRDIHRLTNSLVEGYDFTDILDKYMEEKELKIISVATPSDYERFISQNMRLRKYLKEVEVTPPTKEEAMQILLQSAMQWEHQKRIIITLPVLRKILDESDRYITEVPFPEKALELLDSVVFYREQNGGGKTMLDDANAVLAEKTGVSFTRLTEAEKKQLGNLEEIIHTRLVNQNAAVDLIAKSLRGRSVGIKKESRPVGSFLFLGPTGVGKTETAKVLAKVYYGAEDAIIRFDMAEYAGREGLERLIGSVETNQPGMMTTAIKNKPASLLLLDEFEKASPEIYNLFLTLLDEGSITDAYGRKVGCQHLFVIATSNAGAEYIRQLVNSGVQGNKLQEDLTNYVLEKGIYTPELLNRFDGVVVYEPLKPQHLEQIAQLLLKELSEGLKQKNIYLQVTSEAAKKLAEDGFDPAFGARPMRRIIDLILGDLIGKAMLSGEINAGDTIKIIPGTTENQFSLEKISSSTA
jgi:ATP-dependent Clp protease ATP-binding subunit ClpC